MKVSVIKLGISAMLLLFTVGTVMAAVYTYKCIKCTEPGAAPHGVQTRGGGC